MKTNQKTGIKGSALCRGSRADVMLVAPLNWPVHIPDAWRSE